VDWSFKKPNSFLVKRCEKMLNYIIPYKLFHYFTQNPCKTNWPIAAQFGLFAFFIDSRYISNSFSLREASNVSFKGVVILFLVSYKIFGCSPSGPGDFETLSFSNIFNILSSWNSISNSVVSVISLVVSAIRFTRCSWDTSAFVNMLENYFQKADAFSMSSVMVTSIPLPVVFRSPTKELTHFSHGDVKR